MQLCFRLVGVDTDFELEHPGSTVYTALVHTALLFVSRKKWSDFCSAARTRLQWRNVNIATLQCNPV